MRTSKFGLNASSAFSSFFAMASGRSVPLMGTFSVSPFTFTESVPASENGRTVREMVTFTGEFGFLLSALDFTVTPGAVVVNLPSFSSAGFGRGGFMMTRPAPLVRFVVGMVSSGGTGTGRTNEVALKCNDFEGPPARRVKSCWRVGRALCASNATTGPRSSRPRAQRVRADDDG